MDIPLDEVIHFDAICSSSTGAASDADSTPTFEVFEESTDTDIGVGGNMTKRTSKTGNYRGTFTASAANGFELGKWYSVIGSATVGGVAAKGVLLRFRIVAAENSAGYPIADVAKVGGTNQTAGDLAALLATIAGYIDTEIASLVTDMATLLSRLSSSRAGYLDKLNISGNVAASSEVTAIQNNTTTELIVPTNILRPASGTIYCYFRVYLKDTNGNMEAPDAAPTIDVRDQAGTDLTGRLSDVTGTLEATGQYRWQYASTSTDEAEQILVEVTVVEGGVTRKSGRTAWITDNASTDFTSSDRADLLLIKGYVDELETRITALRAGYLDNLSAGAVMLASSYSAPPSAASIRTEIDNNSTKLAAILADTNELQTDWTNGGRLDDLLDAAASAGSGSGARSVTITIDDGTDPIENARVRMTNGVESYLVETDADGEAVFALDDATWTVTVTKSGYQFTPTTLVVNGTETQTYSMTAISVTPSDPDKVTGYLYCYGSDGEIEADVPIYLWQLNSALVGIAFDSSRRTQNSDESGFVEFTNLFNGAKYRLRRGTNAESPWLDFTIPDDATDPYQLPSIIGE